MSVDRDISVLSHSELVALVQHLRQQLAQQEHEIVQLKRQVSGQAAPLSEKQLQSVEQPTNEGPLPGSYEDLLAQLDKMYPEE